MKLGKAGGPSGVVADMLKAAGDKGMRWMTELCNAVNKELWMAFVGSGESF